ncbi:Major Facilitator Superfamily (MFS) [Thraustotheca clavata]|uniref:Lysosomal dipeptide transporter MFSD1 n=1 Tax=Thraustotheca clavata TaxID=74557 RepID=A0A1V9Z9J9_9STRA|nr:Major Facilitator Superfamily (MFS) [Thraustotheca clavata]
MPSDQTPLVTTSYLLKARPLRHIWSPLSPGHRFFLLLSMCCIAFSGHFIRSGMAAVEQLMLDDKEFPISNTFYGAINSVASIPNFILPFVGGRCLDRAGSKCLFYFVGLMILGQTIFALAMHSHCLWLALFGRFVFGMGEGSVYVGVRSFAAKWFAFSEITCAMGTVVAMTNISRMLSKSTMAPVALYFNDYVAAFWYGDVICLISFGFAMLVVHSMHRLKQLKKETKVAIRNGASIDPKLKWLNLFILHKKSSAKQCHVISWKSLKLVKLLPSKFWLVLTLQVFYVQNFHCFQNISASYLYQVMGYSIIMSGFMSSLSDVLVLFSPFLGLALDKSGCRLQWVVASTLCGVTAYGWFLFASATPVVPLLLISLCLAITPAVLVGILAMTVPKDHCGMAFGVLEIAEAFATSGGNLLVGYLRDTSGSYTSDMIMFFSIAWFTVGLSLVLLCTKSKRENTSCHV